MTDRPILFSGPMVRAILDGKKTQTRRVLKPQIETFDVAPGQPCAVDIAWDVDDGKGRIWKGSYQAGATKVGWKKGTGVLTTQTVPYAPGDRLWVRETWTTDGTADDAIAYRADGEPPPHIGNVRWRPSLYMPRWASRLTLTVTEVRVQRLQDIREEDAIAEGVDPAWGARVAFGRLWNDINGKREGASWDDNPWVCAVSFTAERRNIDDKASDERLARSAILRWERHRG